MGFPLGALRHNLEDLDRSPSKRNFRLVLQVDSMTGLGGSWPSYLIGVTIRVAERRLKRSGARKKEGLPN